MKPKLSLERLEAIRARYQLLTEQLREENLTSEKIVDYSKELAELEPLIEGIDALFVTQKTLEDTKQLVDDPGLEPEMKALAVEELSTLEKQRDQEERSLALLLLPKDSSDEKGAIVELRAGTGGDEAALFVADLSRMYTRYAQIHGWRTEVITAQTSTLGGYKELVMQIQGRGVFARFKYESGTHRVQRVPETETQGRVHTSAATVAVLPEIEEVSIKVLESDLKIDTMRAQGAGGQHVNKTESAIRITHLPTGLVVFVQDERSQHKNRAHAMMLLRSKLFEMESLAKRSARDADRKSQVGSGDRSERIRTYNFPQGRVTDHRINLTLYRLEEVLQGEGLDEVIDALATARQVELLAEDN